MKKVITLIVVAAMLFALCACGDKKPEQTESTTASAQVTEAPTAEPKAEPTAEPTEEPTAEPTEEPTAEPTEEPTEPTEESTEEPIVDPEPLSFLESSFGFVLTTPAGWQIIDGVEGMGYFVADMQLGNNINIVISPSMGVDAATYAMIFQTQLSSMGYTFSEFSEVTLGYSSFVKFTGMTEAEGITITQYIYVATNVENACIITATDITGLGDYTFEAMFTESDDAPDVPLTQNEFTSACFGYTFDAPAGWYTMGDEESFMATDFGTGCNIVIMETDANGMTEDEFLEIIEFNVTKEAEDQGITYSFGEKDTAIIGSYTFTRITANALYSGAQMDVYIYLAIKDGIACAIVATSVSGACSSDYFEGLFS